MLLGSGSHPYLDACALTLLFVTIRLLSAWWSPGIPWACFKPGNLEAGMIGRDERLGVVVVVHNHRAQGATWFWWLGLLHIWLISSQAALNSVPAHPSHWNSGHSGQGPGQSKKNFVREESFFFFNLILFSLSLLISGVAPCLVWRWANTLTLAKWDDVLTLTVKAF